MVTPCNIMYIKELISDHETNWIGICQICFVSSKAQLKQIVSESEKERFTPVNCCNGLITYGKMLFVFMSPKYLFSWSLVANIHNEFISDQMKPIWYDPYKKWFLLF